MLCPQRNLCLLPHYGSLGYFFETNEVTDEASSARHPLNKVILVLFVIVIVIVFSPCTDCIGKDADLLRLATAWGVRFPHLRQLIAQVVKKYDGML